MKKTVLATLMCLASTFAGATTITFDDLNQFQGVANGYQGLNWNGFTIIDTTQYASSGYVNGVVSKNNVAFTYESYGSFSTVGTFAFNSVYLTSAWNNGANVVVTGSLAGKDLYARTLTLGTAAPTLETFDWTGIDKVRFAVSGGTPAGYNGGGSFLAFDNLTVNEAPHGDVPEPGSLALLALGVAGLACMGRRKQHQG
jgi:hypothetical protein